ncbi:MAG: hypothetical protein M3O77_07935 [Chloroflexota bacterium]|nr:hypothetical protein [Chloroflexota bacterium]
MPRIRGLPGSLRDLRLPKDERRAAGAERAEEARLRSERDGVDEMLARRAAEAERRRYGGGTTGCGGGPGF